MAKKSLKIQPKWPSVTNLDNAALPAITTNQPASNTQTNIQASATHHSFFNFVTLATPDDIKIFLNFAATTPEGQNLAHLWQRTYKYGYKNGKKSLLQNLERKMEEKFEEGVARGMDLGREEGYTVAKQGFDGIVKALKDGNSRKKSVPAILALKRTHHTPPPPHLISMPQLKLQKNQNHHRLRVSPRKRAQRLLIGQKTPTHFRSFLHHLHRVNHVIFRFCIHLHHLRFHLFNIA